MLLACTESEVLLVSTESEVQRSTEMLTSALLLAVEVEGTHLFTVCVEGDAHVQ